MYGLKYYNNNLAQNNIWLGLELKFRLVILSSYVLGLCIPEITPSYLCDIQSQHHSGSRPLSHSQLTLKIKLFGIR